MFALRSLPTPVTTVPLVASVLSVPVMTDLGFVAALDDDGAPRAFTLDSTVIMVDGDAAYMHVYATRADALLAFCLI